MAKQIQLNSGEVVTLVRAHEDFEEMLRETLGGDAADHYCAVIRNFEAQIEDLRDRMRDMTEHDDDD